MPNVGVGGCECAGGVLRGEGAACAMGGRIGSRATPVVRWAAASDRGDECLGKLIHD